MKKTATDVLCYIIEWMYLNDGEFKSGADWRKNFIEMLRSEIGKLEWRN